MNTAALRDAFRNKSVFVTGHTGFKGSWLTIWLHELQARISGYSQEVPTSPCNFEVSRVRELVRDDFQGDIRCLKTLHRSVEAADPDVIFHLAAQPIVRASYCSPLRTFETNFMGTCNLLEVLRVRKKPCVVVIVTSDKCYENRNGHELYSEIDTMGGHDPYSASKGATELLAASYRRSFFPATEVVSHGIKVASARAGNVIGGGDWAADRIVPDIVAHLTARMAVPLRNPRSIRPWQHVLAPLHGYLVLAAQMMASDDPALCSGWNFGPEPADCSCVSELVERFCNFWGSGSWTNIGGANQPHEDQYLRLSIAKAAKLGWRPVWCLDETIKHTVRWYTSFARSEGTSMLGACLQDISDYSLDVNAEHSRLSIGPVAVAA